MAAEISVTPWEGEAWEDRGAQQPGGAKPGEASAGLLGEPSDCSPCTARTSQTYVRDPGADGTRDLWHLIFVRSTMCFWKEIEDRQVRASNREVEFSYHCKCQIWKETGNPGFRSCLFHLLPQLLSRSPYFETEIISQWIMRQTQGTTYKVHGISFFFCWGRAVGGGGG